ncbi:MAG: DUF6465 family protein [Clostridiales bacterium]|nr:DUF6465 family protein [Clostridiales bacterium]
MKSEIYVEVEGKQILIQNLEDQAKSAWKNDGKKMKELQTLQIYYKPLEGRSYVVFNGESKGDFFEV